MFFWTEMEAAEENRHIFVEFLIRCFEDCCRRVVQLASKTGPVGYPLQHIATVNHDYYFLSR